MSKDIFHTISAEYSWDCGNLPAGTHIGDVWIENRSPEIIRFVKPD